MKIKKILMILGVGVISLGTLFGIQISSKASNYSEVPKHKGEKPLKTFKYEKTGVIVEVYATNPEDTDKVKKETGWKDGEVEIIKEPLEKSKDREEVLKDKDKAKDATKSKPISLLNSSINFLEKNFETSKAYADAGVWDLVGSEWWFMDGNGGINYEQVYGSHGGDYMFRVPANSRLWGSSGASAYLMEEDPVLADDSVAAFTVVPSSYSLDYVVRGISSYCDGTDGIAEFYTKHYANYAVSGNYIKSVQYFD
jgi:hypothetical protein